MMQHWSLCLLHVEVAAVGDGKDAAAARPHGAYSTAVPAPRCRGAHLDEFTPPRMEPVYVSAEGRRWSMALI